MIKFETTKSQLTTKLNELSTEVEYAYYMAEHQIGPKIYQAFYILQEQKLFEPMRGQQYIIMENMDMDCHAYLTKKSYTDDQKKNIVQQIVDILHKQIFEIKLLCSDIKLANFVVNLNNGNHVVKEIDFSEEWCYLANDELFMPYITTEEYRLKVFYIVHLIQLAYNIYTYTGINYTSTILGPIYQDPYFKDVCEYFRKNPDVIQTIYNDTDLTINFYSDNNLDKIYRAAGCTPPPEPDKQQKQSIKSCGVKGCSLQFSKRKSRKSRKSRK